ncbi:MAG TPA: indole-3-glycerol-phosphate synthase [Steroidobacteraceae bacterium]|nr:indole-3-glycerol-phosphate synthase [Steroidobacteraceae bacterium]
MSGFLAQMAESGRRRARAAAAREPLPALRTRAADTPVPPVFAFDDAFELIAEYKRRSPALGVLADREERIERRVIAYARGGAAAVSVLTEPTRFDGDLVQLSRAASALASISVPVLRKDFLQDPYQVYESRAAGAGGVLLIARMLGDAQLAEMLDCARETSLFTLVEAFDAADVERAAAAIRGLGAAAGAPALIGVNCRDLATLEVLPFRFRELAPLLPADLPRVAESGIATPQQCAEVAQAGYRLALVGGSLMRAADPVRAIREMLAAGRAAALAAA